MESFRAALKRYIGEGHAAPQAMQRVWRDIRAGSVARPVRGKRRRKRGENPPSKKRAPRQRATPKKARRVQTSAKRPQWYYGPSVHKSGLALIFSSTRPPTREQLGKIIVSAVGPFASREAAAQASRRAGYLRVLFRNPTPPARRKHRRQPARNPGAAWHAEKADTAKKEGQRLKRSKASAPWVPYFAGKEDAHRASEKASRRIGLNPRKGKGRSYPLDWHTFAGGTGARERTYSFDAIVPWGEYHVAPPPLRGRRGYRVHFVNTKGLLPGGLWQDLGTSPRPQSAKAQASRHALKVYSGGFVENHRRNPPKKTKVYDRLLEIKAKKGKRGHFPGERFKHAFSSPATVYGLPDGSLHIKGPKRLWADVEV